jgi:hypothetical protein
MKTKNKIGKAICKDSTKKVQTWKWFSLNQNEEKT